MRLSQHDRQLMEGAQGPATRMAMSILIRMGEIQSAGEMMDIDGAHIDSSLYMGEATLEFAERLVEQGARVSVPSTLNVSGVDEAGWQDWAVPPEWALKARRQMTAYQQMGCIPTWTCAPYQTEYKPSFGQQLAWGESNAVVFANSVIGARTERYPDLLDICAAITGRVPAVGLHLEENRRGEILFRLIDIPLELQTEDIFYPVLGHIVGKKSAERVPVLEGIAASPSEDQLKALGAASASSGAVALFHIIGVTPEAASMEAAFHGVDPVQVIEVTMTDLRRAWGELTTYEGAGLDMIVLGSPHFSLEEFRQLAPLVKDRSKADSVRFLVTSSRAMAALAKREGLLDPLRDFGAQVTLDTCILTTPMLPEEIKILMTNSAKYAYYSPGLLNTEVVFGSLADCVESAIRGEVVRDGSLWK